MREFKKDPLRSKARRDVLKALGEHEIINKREIVQLTSLSPATISNILREFRQYQIITCHAGGLYALSGEGREIYLQMLQDKKYNKKEYSRRLKALRKEEEAEERVIKVIYINEEEASKKSSKSC